jgi:hypothetical protein
MREENLARILKPKDYILIGCISLRILIGFAKDANIPFFARSVMATSESIRWPLGMCSENF